MNVKQQLFEGEHTAAKGGPHVKKGAISRKKSGKSLAGNKTVTTLEHDTPTDHQAGGKKGAGKMSR